MSDNPDDFFEEAASHFYKNLSDDKFLNCLIRQKGNEWSFYRYGYQRALEILIDHQKSNSNGQGHPVRNRKE